MLLTIETTGTSAIPATDIGFLLCKHPDRVQQFPTSSGAATVFYPISTPARCRAVLHVAGDSVSTRTLGDADRYVNTLPYAGSSRLMVAMAKVLSDALRGRCVTRPDLIEHRWDLRVTVSSVPVSGDVDLARQFFEPLGWTVSATPTPLQPAQWGPSSFVQLELVGESTVRDALAHLYVLIPALASDKHYFVADDEVEKLVRAGEGWLAAHPAHEQISRRYLKGFTDLTDDAMSRLVPDAVADVDPSRRSVRLREQRRDAVVDQVRALGARSVLDAGCGEGRLLRALSTEPGIGRLAGVDVSMSELNRAQQNLSRFAAVELWQSSLMYADARCRGFDVVILMEVIEHVDLDRLETLEASVFETMAPASVIVTTPNRDHNARYGLSHSEVRHPDHRFEFTRADFDAWCDRVCAEYGYAATVVPVGPVDADLGPSTQMAVFRRLDRAELEVAG